MNSFFEYVSLIFLLTCIVFFFRRERTSISFFFRLKKNKHMTNSIFFNQIARMNCFFKMFFKGSRILSPFRKEYRKGIHLRFTPHFDLYTRIKNLGSTLQIPRRTHGRNFCLIICSTGLQWYRCNNRVKRMACLIDAWCIYLYIYIDKQMWDSHPVIHIRSMKMHDNSPDCWKMICWGVGLCQILLGQIFNRDGGCPFHPLYPEISGIPRYLAWSDGVRSPKISNWKFSPFLDKAIEFSTKKLNKKDLLVFIYSDGQTLRTPFGKSKQASWISGPIT